FSSRRRHTRFSRDWSSDVCSSDLSISLMRICLQFPLDENKKASSREMMRLCVIKNRQRLTLPRFTVVPSALVGLTALFGMGRGDPHRYSHLKIGEHCCSYYL